MRYNNKKIASKILDKTLEENVFHSMGDKYDNGGGGLLKGLLAGGAIASFLGDPDTAHHVSQAFHGAYDNASEFAHNAHDSFFGPSAHHGAANVSYGGYGNPGGYGNYGGMRMGIPSGIPTHYDGSPLSTDEYEDWLNQQKDNLLNKTGNVFDKYDMSGAKIGASVGDFVQNNWQYPAAAAGIGLGAKIYNSRKNKSKPINFKRNDTNNTGNTGPGNNGTGGTNNTGTGTGTDGNDTKL